MKPKGVHLTLWMVVLALILGGFALDLLLPPGIAAAVPYVAPVLLSLWLPDRRAVVIVAAVCTLLTLIGIFVPVSPTAIWQVALNRAFALFAIWVATLLGLQRNGLMERLRHAYEGVERQVAERTAELRTANQRLNQEVHQRTSAEAYSRLILEAVPDGIVVLNPQGVIEYANQQMGAMFGYTVDELLGKPPELLIPEGLRRIHVQHRQGFYLSPRRRPMGTGLAMLGRRKDGSTVPLDATLNSMETSQGIQVVAVVRDVTERVRLQQELVEQESHYRAVVESATDAITISAGGVLVYVNPAFLRINGLSDDTEALGKPPAFLALPQYQEEIRNRIAARLRGEPVSQNNKFLIRRPDGQERVLQGSGVAITYKGQAANLALLRDITSITRAEEELADQQMQYQTLVENANDGVTITMGENRTFANRAYLDIVGASDPSEVVGQHAEKFIHEDDREMVRQRAQARQRGEPSPRVYDYRIRRTDGEVRTVQVSAVAILLRDQPATLSFFRDITERARMVEQLQESNQRLEQALGRLLEAQALLLKQARLNALGQMASGIVHDFNNALTPLVGFSSLLLENPELLNDREAALSQIRVCNESALQAAQIVERLRAFYRPREQAETFAPLDINAVASRAGELTAYVWRNKARSEGRVISLDLALSPVPGIQGEESALIEVLTNLILNAVDAMPQGGTITRQTLAEGNHVRLEVQDSGNGMPQEVLDRCFEPFFTTKGDKGTGLGLAVAYGVIQRHGGDISIASEVGVGTTFTIRLPFS